MAISEQWAELLEPGLRSIFQVQRDALAARSVVPVLFNVVTSSKAEEHDLGMGGFSDWHEYEGAIEYDDNEQLYKTKAQPKRLWRHSSAAGSCVRFFVFDFQADTIAIPP